MSGLIIKSPFHARLARTWPICAVMMVLYFSQKANCQLLSVGYPQLGKPCPDFILKNITHFEKTNASLDDFKGKWLILDFWSLSCITCVKTFPKINQFQKEFTDDIQFVLIATNEKKYYENTKGLYERLANKYKLDIPSTYDSGLFRQFGVTTVPHIIIIDKQGIVRAVTTSNYITHNTLLSLRNGYLPDLPVKPSAFEIEANNKRDNHDTGNSGFRYESVFTLWKPENSIEMITEIDRTINEARYQTFATSLNKLYKLAYFGASDWGVSDSLYLQCWRNPIVNNRDSLLFNPPSDKEEVLFNYSLSVPKERASKLYMKWAMQCDLAKYFGYKVVIKKKWMPCWKLVAINKRDSSGLISNGNAPSFTASYLGLKLINLPVMQLIKTINAHNPLEPPIIDETGIAGNIDLEIDAILTDINDIKKALINSGLDLIKSEFQTNVLVIE